MPIQILEKVLIANSKRLQEYVGQVGVVLGIGEDEGSGYSYAVSIADTGEVVSFWGSELQGTGELVSRDSLFTGESVTIKVDSEGKGDLA